MTFDNFINRCTASCIQIQDVGHITILLETNHGHSVRGRPPLSYVDLLRRDTLSTGRVGLSMSEDTTQNDDDDISLWCCTIFLAKFCYNM